MPDFQNLFQLEVQQKELKDLQELNAAREPLCRRLCYPKRYRSEEYVENEKARIDFEMQLEIENAFKGSGHAFVCFDSPDSMETCLRHFRIGPLTAFRLGLSSAKHKLQELLQPQR